MRFVNRILPLIIRFIVIITENVYRDKRRVSLAYKSKYPGQGIQTDTNVNYDPKFPVSYTLKSDWPPSPILTHIWGKLIPSYQGTFKKLSQQLNMHKKLKGMGAWVETQIDDADSDAAREKTRVTKKHEAHLFVVTLALFVLHDDKLMKQVSVPIPKREKHFGLNKLYLTEWSCAA